MIGSGTVISLDGGINCSYLIEGDNNADCTEVYPTGTVVTLIATPGPDSTFAFWSSECSVPQEDVCMVSLDASRSVIAQFATLGPKPKL